MTITKNKFYASFCTFGILFAAMTLVLGCGGGDEGLPDEFSQEYQDAVSDLIDQVSPFRDSPDDLSQFSNFTDNVFDSSDFISISGGNSGTFSTTIESEPVTGVFIYTKTGESSGTLEFIFLEFEIGGTSFTPDELAALANAPVVEAISYDLVFYNSGSSYNATAFLTDGTQESESGLFSLY